jgi:RNA-directed DNA polymerase
MSTHSNGGCKTNIETKLERVARRAAEETDCVFNNLGHVIDFNLLLEQYHRMDGGKAVGIDEITKQRYGENVRENLEKLIQRIRRGAYRPQPCKLVEIPKEDGSKRPLAIACFEDKLVQSAANAILCKLYEPIFLPCSYGFRPNLSCHDALKALMAYTYKYKDGAVVEIDIQKYFNTIPQGELIKMMEMKISDGRFMNLLKILMQTPTIVDGVITPNIIGCPQGSIISPVFANIYLHYVIDAWFHTTVKQHIRGKAEMVRYADDMVFIFENKNDAQRFFKTLGKRLEHYGLKLHFDKSQLLESGRNAAARAVKQGKRLGTYKFLGFVCYWGKSRKGFYRLKLKSRSDRFSLKLRDLRKFLWLNLNAKSRMYVVRRVIRTVKGWINYHAISDNDKRVKAFALACKRLLFKWLNRRGGKRRTNWTKFIRILNYAKYPVAWKIKSMFENSRSVGKKPPLVTVGSRMR